MVFWENLKNYFESNIVLVHAAIVVKKITNIHQVHAAD